MELTNLTFIIVVIPFNSRTVPKIDETLKEKAIIYTKSGFEIDIEIFM